MLKGSIYILGFYLKCDILINFPKAIRLAVEMSPINIGGGLIKLTRRANDLENGPKLLVAISSQEVFCFVEKCKFEHIVNKKIKKYKKQKY